MKNIDLLDLSYVLENVDTKESSVKFKYFISKNKQNIDGQVKILKDLIKPSDEYMKVENERIAICEKYSVKNENNEPIKEKSGYIISNDKIEEFNKEIKNLFDENDSILKKEIEKSKEIEAILQEEITNIVLDKININDLPNNVQQIEMDILVKLDLIY
jgi:hypothetical protein